MKIRSGFVSNSSSSSFVLMGFEYSEEELLAKAGYASADEDDEDYDEKEKAIRSFFKTLKPKYGSFEILNSGEVGLKHDVFGFMLNSDLEESSTDATSVSETSEKLKMVMAEFGVEKDIKIYSGSRYC